MKPFWKIVAAVASLLYHEATAASTPRPSSYPLTIPPVVSKDWLQENLLHPQLLILDLRNATAYTHGHVPGALSVPFDLDSLWSKPVTGDTFIMPPAADILPALSAQGLTARTNVVLVTSAHAADADFGDPSEGLNDATRAAVTLQYAGLSTNKIGILDGGYEAWIGAEGEESREHVAPQSSSFTGPIEESLVVDRDYVHETLNKPHEGLVLVDVRPAAQYDRGHIESAFNIPQAEIWNKQGTFKSASQLEGLFNKGVGNSPVGPDKGQVIVYCDHGKTATSWHFVLTNILGYDNVKLYDGSIQDWKKRYPLVSSH